jgi:hypothetical protein
VQSENSRTATSAAATTSQRVTTKRRMALALGWSSIDEQAEECARLAQTRWGGGGRAIVPSRYPSHRSVPNANEGRNPGDGRR